MRKKNINLVLAISVLVGSQACLCLAKNGAASAEVPESISNIDKFEGRTLEAACRMSEWIGDCEYTGYTANGPITLSNPPIAKFRYGQYGTTLKGPPLGHDLPVRFEFDQPDTQESRATWKFTPSMMPPQNSRWILFIPNLALTPGKGFETYKGGYGRVPATAESLKAVRDLITKNSVDDESKIASSRNFKELDEAFTASEWIAECEYRGYQEHGKTTLKNPPTAELAWLRVFKGPPLATCARIIFEFDLPSSAEEERLWKFSPSMMPEKKSRWIIFVQNAVPVSGGFLTYKGSLGRVPATPENLKTLEAVIEKRHGTTY